MADGLVIPATGTGTSEPEVATRDGGTEGQFQRVIVEAVDPEFERLTSADLAAGGSVELTASDITTGKTGHLVGADIGASVALRVDIQTVVGAARTIRTTVLSPPGETIPWRSIEGFIKQAGGANQAFGCEVFNLDPTEPANVYVTVFWDECNT